MEQTPQQPLEQTPPQQPSQQKTSIKEFLADPEVRRIRKFLEESRRREEAEYNEFIQRRQEAANYLRQQCALPLSQRDPLSLSICAIVNAVEYSKAMTEKERNLRKKRNCFVGPSLRQEKAQRLVEKIADKYKDQAPDPEFILSNHSDVLQKKIQNALIGIYAEYGHALTHFDDRDAWAVGDPSQLPITPATLVVDADFFYTKVNTVARPTELMIVTRIQPNDSAVAFIRFVVSGWWPEPIRKSQRKEAHLEVNLAAEDLTCRCQQIFPQVLQQWLDNSDAMSRLNSIRDYVEY